MLQITAKVGEKIVKRLFFFRFRYPVGSEKVKLHIKKYTFIRSVASVATCTHARTVRTCVPVKVEGEKNNNKIRYESE